MNVYIVYDDADMIEVMTLFWVRPTLSSLSPRSFLRRLKQKRASTNPCTPVSYALPQDISLQTQARGEEGCI